MNTIRMWKAAPDLRPWAEVVGEGRGHLLALLLSGDLYSKDSCEMALEAARKSVASKEYDEDLGFFNAAGLYFTAGQVKVDHALLEYGLLTMDAGQFEYLLSQWLEVVTSREPIELLADVRFDWS